MSSTGMSIRSQLIDDFPSLHWQGLGEYEEWIAKIDRWVVYIEGLEANQRATPQESVIDDLAHPGSRRDHPHEAGSTTPQEAEGEE